MASKTASEFSLANDETEWNYPLAFDVNGEIRRIFVNRGYLAAISPIFNRLFFDSKFTDSKKAEIHMEGKSYEEFLIFIESIAITHNRDRGLVDTKNVEVLLRYADEYGIGSLLHRCGKFMNGDQGGTVQNTFDRERIVRYASLAATYGLTELNDLWERMAQFPLAEIRALNASAHSGAVICKRILEAKTKRSIRANCHVGKVKHWAPKRGHWSCSACEASLTGDCLSCQQCFLDGGEKQYCQPCFDKHIVYHADPRPHCPVCRQRFVAACHESKPDVCACRF